MNRVADMREQLVTAKKGVGPDDMIELLGVSFLADEPAIFGEPNQGYVDRELEWYLTRQPYLSAMAPPVPKIWQRVAGDDGRVNSHYGHLVYSAENGSQFDRVVTELKRDRASRRAVMVYTNPGMHDQAVAGGRDDFVCTNVVQHLVRSEQLHTVVQMRSNDAIFGYRNDYPWQRYVQERLAEELDVEPGPIIWQVGSLHVYPRHRHLVP